MGKKIKAEQSLKLPEGSYKGVVSKINFVETPYEYTEIFVKETTKELELKVGVPTKITENTALGIILQNFGIKIEVGKEYDIEETLIGKSVKFLVKEDKTDKGTFARIVSETLKPDKE